jgi:uroporphyrinogen decarboxylase
MRTECWEKYLGVSPKGFRVAEGGGTSWIADRPFHDVETLKRNLPKMPNIDEVAEWYVPFIKRVKKVFDENDLVFIGEVEGPLTDAYNFVDMERFCCLIYDDPDIVDYMLDVTTAWSSIIIKLYCEFPASRAFVFGEDIAYKTSTMFSRDFLREKLYPRWKKAVEPLRQAGIKLIYHSDGNLNTVLDDLIGEIGIDGLNPIEPTADMDIFGISEKYPDLLLFGNIDTAGELLNDDPCAVEEAVQKLLYRVGKKGRLLAGSSTEISDAVKLPNVLALYAAIRKYGSLL